MKSISIRYILLQFLLIFITSCSLAKPTLTFTEYYDNGVKAWKAGDFHEAISSLSKAIELDPNTSDAYGYRGVAYGKIKEYEKAMEDLNIYLDKIPGDAGLRGFRGHVLIKLGQVEKGMAELEKDVKMYPDNPEVYNEFCWDGSLFGDVNSVLLACEKAVELAPKEGLFYDSRGLARALSGDISGALEDFNVAVTWMRDNKDYQKYVDERERWIFELEAGRTPFDEATLEKLREEE